MDTRDPGYIHNTGAQHINKPGSMHIVHIFRDPVEGLYYGKLGDGTVELINGSLISGGTIFTSIRTVAGQLIYLIPILLNRTVKIVNLQNSPLVPDVPGIPGQYTKPVGSNIFTLVGFDPADIEDNMFLNIGYET